MMGAEVEIIRQSPQSVQLKFKGEWTRESLDKALKTFRRCSAAREFDRQNIRFDFSETGAVDSAGMILIVRQIDTFCRKNCSVTAVNMNDDLQKLLIFHRKNFRADKVVPRYFSNLNLLYAVGKKSRQMLHGFADFLVFIGQISTIFLLTLLRPSLLRVKAIVKQIELSGVQALPIVSLTAFLVGLVVAYQGAAQLQKFGANIFIVEMVAISIFRELAPMITAIVIAGRSASAYTAEIGTMKITEEVDAMKTMGFEPVRYLVLPRIFALMLSMPLIVFFADLVGVFGGMLIADLHLEISFTEFIHRLHAEVPIKHLMIGLIKAPLFGFIVAAIGCFRGFQVEGSTDSIGYYTTVSVVNAIFWVIAINALISVLLTEMGI